MKRALVVCMALAMTVCLSGCILLVAAAAAGGVAWYMGEGAKTYPHGVKKVYGATLDALEKNSVAVALKSADNVSGLIEGKFADGKDLKVKFEAEGENVTKVKVRVGTMGDKDKTNFIFGQIDRYL